MKITITIEMDENELINEKEREREKVVEKTGSIYSRIFDEGSSLWTEEKAFNEMFIRYVESYADDKLKSKGYLFLNDVYEMLGIPKTKIGQITGWRYNTENPMVDNKVIFDVQSIGDNSFIIDFNVDGKII